MISKLTSVKKMYLVNFFISISLYFPVEVAYLNSLGFSSMQITVINLCLPLFIGILEIPTGHLGDLISRKKVMLYSILTFVISLLTLIIFRNFHMILIAYFLEGLGWSLASGNNESLLKDIVNADVSKFNKSLSKFYEFSFLATLTSSILLVIITTFYGENYTLLLIVTFIIRLFALVMGLMIKETSTNGKESMSNTLTIGNALKAFLQSSETISIGIYEGIGRFQFFFPTIYQIILLLNGFPLNYIVYINFGYVVFQFLVQRYSQHIIKFFKRRLLLVILPILQSLLMLSLFSKNIVIIAISIIIIYMCIPLKTQITNEYKHIYIDDDNRSTYISVVSFISLVFSTVVFFAIGYIFDHSHFMGEISMILSISIISILCVKNITKLDRKFE